MNRSLTSYVKGDEADDEGHASGQWRGISPPLTLGVKVGCNCRSRGWWNSLFFPCSETETSPFELIQQLGLLQKKQNSSLDFAEKIQRVGGNRRPRVALSELSRNRARA